MSAGQHVRRELHALEVAARSPPASVFKRERLRQTRHAFEKDVAVADEAHHEPVDELLLADDDARHLLPQAAAPTRTPAGRDPALRGWRDSSPERSQARTARRSDGTVYFSAEKS